MILILILCDMLHIICIWVCDCEHPHANSLDFPFSTYCFQAPMSFPGQQEHVLRPSIILKRSIQSCEDLQESLVELFLLELNHFSNALNTSLAVDNFLLPGHQAQSFCHLNIGALGTACNALTCQFFWGFGTQGLSVLGDALSVVEVLSIEKHFPPYTAAKYTINCGAKTLTNGTISWGISHYPVIGIIHMCVCVCGCVSVTNTEPLDNIKHRLWPNKDSTASSRHHTQEHAIALKLLSSLRMFVVVGATKTFGILAGGSLHAETWMLVLRCRFNKVYHITNICPSQTLQFE